jgi:hypothetical protein
MESNRRKQRESPGREAKRHFAKAVMLQVALCILSVYRFSKQGPLWPKAVHTKHAQFKKVLHINFHKRLKLRATANRR